MRRGEGLFQLLTLQNHNSKRAQDRARASARQRDLFVPPCAHATLAQAHQALIFRRQFFIKYFRRRRRLDFAYRLCATARQKRIRLCHVPLEQRTIASRRALIYSYPWLARVIPRRDSDERCLGRNERGLTVVRADLSPRKKTTIAAPSSYSANNPQISLALVGSEIER